METKDIDFNRMASFGFVAMLMCGAGWLIELFKKTGNNPSTLAPLILLTAIGGALGGGSPLPASRRYRSGRNPSLLPKMALPK